MFNTKEKIERRLGTKLFLKAYRCNSPKCAMIRRASRPGMHKHSRIRRSSSEFGQLLNEKQKVRASYGLREAQMRKVFSAAAKKPDATGGLIIQLLERRLDNVVFRLGLAMSRSIARQLVGHGHIFMNGRKVTIPSYLVKIGDRIGIRPQSRSADIFKDFTDRIKNYKMPIWLKFDEEKLEGEVISLPKDLEAPFDINMVVDYYSK